MAGLSHPHIAKLYGHGVVESQGILAYFIVVERLMRGTLADCLVELKDLDHRARLVQALPHLSGIADALRYLHYSASPDHTICHRDLKPDNFGFTEDGVIKLFDFGLCAVLPRVGSHAGGPEGNEAIGNGMLCGGYSENTYPIPLLQGETGSIRYMAPEVALGGLYDESVDIFSFSLIAWETLHVRKPYQGLNVATHRRVVCLGGKREEVDRALPAALASLLSACWATDPSERPSAEAFAQALQCFVASSAATHPEKPQGTSRWCSRGFLFGYLSAKPHAYSRPAQ